MWLRRILARSSRYDWTTTDGVLVALQKQLKLENYGTMFHLYENNMPLDEQSARNFVIQAIISSPMISQYQRTLQHMLFNDDNPDYYEMSVQPDPSGRGLVFEHGDFTSPVDTSDLKVSGPGTEIHKTKQQVRLEEQKQKLDEKLQKIQNTDEMDYLYHANQCGYLTARTKMRFWHLEGMWATTVATAIPGISIEQLRGFVDATGQNTLSEISTHAGYLPDNINLDTGILANHRDFARQIMNFLNLEFIIDIDSIVADYREIIGDSGFKSIEEWGGSKDVVLNRIINRRQNIDADTIRDLFEEGYSGNLES